MQLCGYSTSLRRSVIKNCIKKGDTLEVSFYVPSRIFPQVITVVKSFRGRVFDPVDKVWRIPYSAETALALEKAGFELKGDLKQLVHIPVEIPVCKEPQASIDTSLLPATIRPYQTEAVRFLEATNGMGLIALGCRMGKSLVSLCYTMLHPELSLVLIVCPASAKIIWEREIRKWTGKRAEILSGTTTYAVHDDADFLIINYDILYSWLDYLKVLEPKVFIVDESHRVSNPTTAQRDEDGALIPVKCTKAFQVLSDSIPHVIALSGTPATRVPAQMQTVLGVLDKKHFGNRYHFLHAYCDPRMGDFGWEFKGLSNEDKLVPLLSQVMFRRTKDQVFSQLPKEMNIMLPMQIDMSIYTKELETLMEWYGEQSNVTDEEIQMRIERFKSLSYASKRDQIIDWIRDYLTTGEKLVVVGWHRAVLVDLYKTFGKQSVRVWGDTEADEKQSLIDSFNTDPDIKLFIGNIRTCKEAISLYGSDSMLFVEFDGVSSGDFTQMKERLWLPDTGQQKFCYYYAVADCGIDKARLASLQENASMMSRLLDRRDKSLFGD